MRILHLCLSNWFVDGVGYQENELVREHVLSGHEVLVISSTETHSKDGKLVYIEPRDYIGCEGARVIRISYSKLLPHYIMRKLRIHKGLKNLILKFDPNVILFHGACGWELLTVYSYVRNNKDVLWYIDSHEDQYNSARNWLSKEILHKIYYGSILRYVLPKVKKILCYSTECIDFVSSIYRIPLECLELYPLGGRPVAKVEYKSRRTSTREYYGIDSNMVLIVQSGRLSESKKVLASLKAFCSSSIANLRFILVGVIEKGIEIEFNKLVQSDNRIHFVGWKSFDDLTSILCAADIYLQPGTQSVTMQHSLCCHCAVILDNVPSHQIYMNDNGWLIGCDRMIIDILNNIPNFNLPKMQQNSYELALNHLDYRVLALRVLN
jgi:1,2-diacylglycerol 3-alpha-glucosyltransferase